MPAPLDASERKKFLPSLWAVFLDKIDREWSDKYAQLGENREEVEFDTHLAHAVHADMVSAARQRGVQDATITAHTLYQYLDRGGLPKGAKANTILIFLRYCGYEDWAAFTTSVDTHKSKKKSKQQKTAEARKNPFRNPWNYLGPILLLFFIPVGLSMLEKDESQGILNKTQNGLEENNDQQLETELETLILAANTLEFSLRKQAPDWSDTTLLDRYFTNGPARSRLIGSLMRNAEKNLVLDTIASSFALLDMKYIGETNDYYEIETREHWYLRWKGADTKQDALLYDVINFQPYFIAKTPDGPRIHVNKYEGATEIIDL